jgi:hypothetical protein
MGKEDDFWYAVSVTRVLLAPRQTLETFGATTIRYHLISELMDDAGKVRVREGRVRSERPQIITPSQFAEQLLEGFGDKARHYAEWLMRHNEMARILRYGLHFKKDEVSQEIVTDTLDAVGERVKADVEGRRDPLTAVLIGADEMWEVSLLRFVVDYIEHSAPANLQDFNQRAREDAGFQSAMKLQEVEADFQRAAQNPAYIGALGDKLQRLGVFDRYEDRFYALVRRHR